MSARSRASALLTGVDVDVAPRLSNADPSAVEAVVASLGLGKRRAVTLIRLSRDYLRPGWTDARVLSGVGEYAGRAHDIFCRGILGDSPPNDHALTKYWHFAKLKGARR